MICLKKTVGIYDHGKQWEVFVKLSEKDIRYAICYYMAIETGLRISDILALTRPIPPIFTIREAKTGKLRAIQLSDDLRNMLEIYEQLVPQQFSKNLMFPFARSTFWRHMKIATEACGLKRVGVHGLRKTYG